MNLRKSRNLIFSAVLIVAFAYGSFGGLTHYIAGGMLLVVLAAIAGILLVVGLVVLATLRKPALVYLALALLLTIAASAGLGVVYADWLIQRTKSNAMKLAEELDRFKASHRKYPGALGEIEGSSLYRINLDNIEYEPLEQGEDYVLRTTIYCEEYYQKSYKEWRAAICR